MKPVIALVGRPNVGKSTLFNVLTRTRDALVADYAGLTRDRKYGHGSYDDKRFIVIDTGGLSGENEAIDETMAKQTLLAIDESNVILFMVDARDGLSALDEAIAERLRRTGKTVHLVLNKTDGLDERLVASDFYALGLGEPHTIAASQNRGIKQMLDKVLPESAETEEAVDDKQGIKVAFVGRPNVGKSTLVNRIMGEERVVVFDMPGTTRDSIYVPFERNDQHYTLIDTAGVRRKRSVDEAIEKFSIIKAMQAIDESNVVVMVMDARTEIADQDLHLLGYILEAGRALVLAINKWDGLDEHQKYKIQTDIEKQLTFTDFAELFFISALHGSSVGKLYGAINRAYESAMKDMSTPELSRILEKAVEAHQPPLVHGRRVKLRYAHQGGMNPPRIVIHGNNTDLLPAPYRRYLVNYFRKATRSVGTPIKIEFKGGDNPFSGRRNVLTKRQQAKRKRLMTYVKKRDQKRKNKR